MSAEEEKQPEQSDSKTTPDGGRSNLVRQDTVNQGASHEQAKQPTNEKREFSSRISNAWHKSYRLRQFVTNPMALIEVAALGTLIWYTHRAGQQADAALKAAKAAKRAADISACALKDSETSFAQTLCQMQAQTTAQQGTASAAQQSAAVADKSLKSGLRAWIMPVYGGTPVAIAPHSDIAEDFTLVNNGKTPAVDIRGYFVIDVYDNATPPTFDYSRGRGVVTISIGMLFPGSPRPVPIRAVRGTQHVSRAADLSDEDSRKISFNEAYAPMFGNIEYSDIFGHKHWTHVCRYTVPLTPKPAAVLTGRAACAAYNRVDGDSE